MSNILVLGANGFIGSNLINELLRENHMVIGYDVGASIRLEFSDQYIHHCGDFTREKDFLHILREHEITVIYHLISTTVPRVGTGQLEQEIRDNLFPTLCLLEAAKDIGIQKIIFASSGGTVYGDNCGSPHTEAERLSPICGYGIQKMMIESYLRLYFHDYGLDYAIIRISNPYGCCMQQNRVQGIIPLFIRALYQGKSIELYGNTVRDYIYIDDVSSALVKAAFYQGESKIFNIGSGEGHYLADVVKIIEQEAGQTFSRIQSRSIRLCDVQENVLDISNARQELNWRPSVSLRTGIQMSLEQIRLLL